ncbi:MAG: ABC transporter substrate-binding protein [bacterium]|nr:ABC transporter substrate-binding protein [bacterium]
MNKRITKLLVAGTLAASMMLTACGKNNEDEDGLKKVTVILDWTANTNHTGLYVAKEKGYYKDLGLDVEIVEPAEGSSLQLLAAGKGDFAVSYQEDFTYALTAENKLPLKAVAAIIQHNTSGYTSPASKGIKTVKDFEGKVYGGYGGPSEDAILKMVMEAGGADFSKLTSVVVGTEDFFMATKNNIDFELTFEGWTNIEAKLKGEEVNFIPLRELNESLDYYTPIIATSNKVIENDEEMIYKFMEATTKGYEFAIENPKEAAEVLVTEVPGIDKELAVESQKYLAGQYKADASKWGEMKDSVWNNYTKVMLENKLIQEDLAASEAYTNEYLPK